MNSPAPQSTISIALSLTQKLMLPLLLAFVAAVMIGISTSSHDTSDGPRTVDLHVRQFDAVAGTK